MECHRIPRQAHHGFRRIPKCPSQNWRGVINRDLKKIGIGWDEVHEAAEDRRSRCICVAHCVFDEPGTSRCAFRAFPSPELHFGSGAFTR